MEKNKEKQSGVLILRYPPVGRHHFIPLILCYVIMTEMIVNDNVINRGSFFVHSYPSSTTTTSTMTKKLSLPQQQQQQQQKQQQQQQQRHISSSSTPQLEKQRHHRQLDKQKQQLLPGMEVSHTDRHLAHALTLVRQWDLHLRHYDSGSNDDPLLQQQPVTRKDDDDETDRDSSISLAADLPNEDYDRINHDWKFSFHLMSDMNAKVQNDGRDYIYHDFSLSHGRLRRGEQMMISLQNDDNDSNFKQEEDLPRKLSSADAISQFGWTPNEYPNPVSQPFACHVDSFENDKANLSSKERFLLCDPDSILNYTSRKKVADALLNFTKYYGPMTSSQHDTQHLEPAKLNNSNNITKAETRKLLHRQQTQPKTSENSIETKEDSNSLKQKNNNDNSTLSKKWLTSFPTTAFFYENVTSLPEMVGNKSDSFFSGITAIKNKMSTYLPVKQLFDHQRMLHNNPTTITSMNQKNMYTKILSLDGTFFDDGSNRRRYLPPIEIGIAITKKMNLSQLLRSSTYYTYEQDDDLVNDAAQYFARYLHKSWWSTNTYSSSSNKENYNYKLDLVQNQSNEHTHTREHDDDDQYKTNAQSHISDKNDSVHYDKWIVGGILIFLSIEDRICFISAGPVVSSVLPWWRLERVIVDMKPDLHRGTYDKALLGAIENLASMIESGSPTSSERILYFMSRYGIVLVFATFTFVFAAWGEMRENRNRWEYVESRTRLSKIELDKARELQKQFRDRMCPICLEDFQYSDGKGTDGSFTEMLGNESDSEDLDTETTTNERSPKLKSVDSYGIPLRGTDGLPLRILKCGHIFDQTCWKLWANSGQGNPFKCPVCRQNVGTCKPILSREQSRSPEGLHRAHEPRHLRNNEASTSIRTFTSSTPLNVSGRNRSNYNSIIQTDHESDDDHDFMVVIDVEQN